MKIRFHIRLLGVAIGLITVSNGVFGQGKLPTVGFSAGNIIFLGDIKSVDYKPGFGKKIGYQFYLEQPVAKYLSVSLNFMTGKVYGAETILGSEINFQSSVFSQSLRLKYNFFPLLKYEKKPLFSPYFAIGLGMVMFRSKGDLKNSSGVSYSNLDPAGGIEKDHSYETDLRDANLDKFGKYSQVTFTVPIAAGVDIKLTRSLAARVFAEYHLTFSDLIDNISFQGSGARQGKQGNDNYLFAAIGINYNLSGIESSPDKINDLDSDGIVDSRDKCSGSPLGVKVDKNGCPVDENKDGTPDYLEAKSKSSNSTDSLTINGTINPDGSSNSNQPVNENGTFVNPTATTGQAGTTSAGNGTSAISTTTTGQTGTTTAGNGTSDAGNTSIQNVGDVKGNSKNSTKNSGNTNSTENNSKDNVGINSKLGKFHYADFNKNGHIEPDEVTRVIDLFFDGEKTFSVEGIQELIDFYFDQ